MRSQLRQSEALVLSVKVYNWQTPVVEYKLISCTHNFLRFFYWARLQTMPNSEILNKCLKIQEKLHTNGQRNWYTKVKHIISEANIINWQALEPSVLTNKIKLVLYDNEKDRILHEINDTNAQPKLRTYKTFKTSYCIEPYLLLNLPKKTYSNIARFRVSSHNLKIETGRHESPKIPLHERICEYSDSGEIEDTDM